MTPDAFRAAIARLGLTQTGAARAFRTGERTVRHWAFGDRAVPPAVELLLWACERDPTLLEALREPTL
jgi:DNA-binding transcriptional regulator YiaG